MRKFDKIIIVFFLILALVLGAIIWVVFRGNTHKNYNKKYAEIYVKGKLYKKVVLDKNKPKEVLNIKTDLGENIVEIYNGGVRIIEANCPDKICIKDGFKDKIGDVLVCLPHKVMVQIKGEGDKASIDEVSH